MVTISDFQKQCYLNEFYDSLSMPLMAVSRNKRLPQSGRVHTKKKKFDTRAFFLRLGLLCTSNPSRKRTFISKVRPTVHTNLHENRALLFLQLGLPSTPIRHENEALFVRLGLPPTLIRHENINEALFLRLSLPSTLIHHGNDAFPNFLQTGGILKRRLFVFACTENS